MKKKKCTGCGTTHDCKGNKASANEQIKSFTRNKTLEYGKKNGTMKQNMNTKGNMDITKE
jgi:hypothetical protein